MDKNVKLISSAIIQQMRLLFNVSGQKANPFAGWLSLRLPQAYRLMDTFLSTTSYQNADTYLQKTMRMSSALRSDILSAVFEHRFRFLLSSYRLTLTFTDHSRTFGKAWSSLGMIN